MKDYPAQNIRNVALVGHSGTGKTSLAEALLFVSGGTNRQGKIEEGTTVSDWDPDEQKRRFSLNLSLLPVEWNGYKVNVLDTPGYMDFMGEVKCGLRAVELALITLDAVSGMQVGTEFAWRFAEELELPRAVFINRMDRENADFFAGLSQVQNAWGNKCVPLQIPIGSQHSFEGVVDLLSMKAYTGDKSEEGEVPADLTGQAQSLREKLIEAAAETDDSLITKYLEGEDLSEEELATGVRAGIAGGSIVPVLTGSSTKTIGARRLLETIASLFPSPADRPVRTDSTAIVADPVKPLTALVFKTSADPYVGRLTYFRVFQGTLKSDSQVWNANKQA